MADDALFGMIADEHGIQRVDHDSVGKFQAPGRAAETQQAAAVLIYPATGTQRRRVLEYVASGDATDEEIQDALRMNPSTERPRRVELVEQGWIEDSGMRRRTRAGRYAVVWKLAVAARDRALYG